jgi:hypothetical protein
MGVFSWQYSRVVGGVLWLGWSQRILARWLTGLGDAFYERIERTIVEHHTKPPGADEPVDERPPQEFEPPTNGRHWSS